MDAGIINEVLFLDLCKAFDTVDHKILIKKLFIYGIQNKWFKSYLYRTTPQGSNLGSLLFLIYVNDPPNCLENSHAAMYADDTNITARLSSLCNVED
jgi:hypothetical protein